MSDNKPIAQALAKFIADDTNVRLHPRVVDHIEVVLDAAFARGVEAAARELQRHVFHKDVIGMTGDEVPQRAVCVQRTYDGMRIRALATKPPADATGEGE